MKTNGMDRLVDDAARILAGSVPRRQALKDLGRLLVGTVVAVFFVREAAADDDDHDPGCRPKCRENETCCVGRSNQRFCSPPGGHCCGDTACGSGFACCRNNVGQGACAGGSNFCCGGAVCTSGEICCGGQCCPRGQSCFEGRCFVSRT